MEKSLKEKNQKTLWIFYSLNIICFLLIFTMYNVNSFNTIKFLNTFILKRGWLLIISPIIVAIINGIFSAYFKGIIVFWRIKNVLPGCRVFSKLAPKDVRVNMKNLKSKLGKIPIDPKQQNILWYSLLKKNEDKPSVIESHKKYLLVRDMAAFSLLSFLIFLIFQFFLNVTIQAKIILLCYLSFQYLTTSHVARIYGNRFVCNVIAEESWKNS